MNLIINSTAVCRTPAFSFNQKLEDVWPELKVFIKDSSPAFYAEIADVPYQEIASLNPKLRFTIWKYFNRARFRATPYGKFASFSVVPIKNAETSEVKLENKFIHHSFADWPETVNLDFNPELQLNRASFFISNSTYYPCGTEIRYLFFENEQFELATVKSGSMLKQLLQFCSEKRTTDEVNTFLTGKFRMDAEEVKLTLLDMVEAQLLLTDLALNITGEDYFKRTGHTPINANKEYLIGERKLLSGQISNTQLANIKGSIEALANIIPNKDVKVLDDFKKAFIGRFEHKVLPLQMVLDPETGIGYAGFEQKQEDENLVKELLAMKEKPQPATTSIRDKWLIQKISGGEQIRLEEHPAAGQPADKVNIPNNFSALLSVINEDVIMEMCGGVTATSLMGRFTMASDTLETLALNITADEQDSNPGVLFFDIAYHGDRQVDNVNRRKSMYPYELPILTWTTHQQVLNVNDLYVTVRNNQVMLFSRAHNKRVIPRLGSSYNYTRSSLSLFRFLSDLQKQQLQINFNINIQEMMPGLDHYPRVSYKNIILNLKKSRVPIGFCTTHFLKSADALPSFQNWVKHTEIVFFRCGQHDQKLYFNCDNKQDMLSFLMYAQGKADLYIEEVPLPSRSFFKDESGLPFAAEMILSIQHRQSVYQPLHIAPNELQATKKQISLPGDEWLYFEIYCHNTQSNPILINLVTKLTALYRDRINKWFFIRYDKPSPHLRIRIKLNNKADFQLLVTVFTDKLKPDMISGLVHDYAIKTYYPENERYTAENIDNIEQCFYASSNYIVQLLGYEPYQQLHYSLTMNLMDQVLALCKFDLKQQLAFYRSMANLFATEMQLKNDAFKKINKAFKDLESPLPATRPAEKRLALQQELLSKQFAAAINTHQPALRTKLIADLFHMHINRLFDADQRMNELLIYHYLVIRVQKNNAGRT